MNMKNKRTAEQARMPKWSFSSAEKKKYIAALTECLRELRETSETTQGELAEIAGVSRQTYGSIELKKREMSWKTYMSLIFYFDYNPRTHGIIRKRGLFYSEFDETSAYITQPTEKGNENAEGKELFEDIRVILGLDYISDIRFEPNTKRAIVALQMADLRKYSLAELSDMANYINGSFEEFADHESATAFFAHTV